MSCVRKDITGQTSGKLTALEVISQNTRKQYIWLCRCACGALSEVSIGNWTRIKSCGRGSCRHKPQLQHGHAPKVGASATYETWKGMVQRCTNPNDRRRWENYGGRGITVCERWLKFENFLADMGERPKGLTLDRKNNDKGYSKANCRWATRSEQMRNRRGQCRKEAA
jgi:hypothetical protein